MADGPSTRVRIFGATLLLLWLPMLVAYGTLRGQASELAQADLDAELEGHVRLAAALFERVPAAATPETRAVVRKVATATGARVVLVSQTQEVVADSAPQHLESLRPMKLPDLGEAHTRGIAQAHHLAENGLIEAVVAVPWLADGRVQGTLVVAGQTPADGWLGSGTTLVFGLFAGFGLALVAAWMSTRLAAGAIRSLTDVASKMAAGNLGARSQLGGNDEFAELGRALDDLAQSLSDKVRQLRAGKDRLGKVLSSMHEGVLLADRDGKVQLVNGALVEMLYLAPQPVGKAVSEVIEYPELLDMFDMAEAGTPQSAELTMAKLPGRNVLTNVRSLPEDGGVLAVLVDISEQRRLETVRQEFVANASHELRTPIAAIISAVETLETIYDGRAEGANFLNMINRNAHRLRALVDDLLTLSHIESGTIEVELEPVKLRPAIEAIMDDFTPRARDKGTELICLVPSDVVVMASVPGLQHVIGNLVDNAIKYSPEGAKVVVEVKREGPAAAVCVRDNGPGIPEEHRQRIFERFYRVDTGRSRAVGGTGLGLSIVKHWAEAMEGSVRAAAAEPQGTAIILTLAQAPN